jgi:hypothetical protein
MTCPMDQGGSDGMRASAHRPGTSRAHPGINIPGSLGAAAAARLPDPAVVDNFYG